MANKYPKLTELPCSAPFVMDEMQLHVPQLERRPYSCSDFILRNETNSIGQTVLTYLHPDSCAKSLLFRSGKFDKNERKNSKMLFCIHCGKLHCSNIVIPQKSLSPEVVDKYPGTSQLCPATVEYCENIPIHLRPLPHCYGDCMDMTPYLCDVPKITLHYKKYVDSVPKLPIFHINGLYQSLFGREELSETEMVKRYFSAATGVGKTTFLLAAAATFIDKLRKTGGNGKAIAVLGVPTIALANDLKNKFDREFLQLNLPFGRDKVALFTSAQRDHLSCSNASIIITVHYMINMFDTHIPKLAKRIKLIIMDECHEKSLHTETVKALLIGRHATYKNNPEQVVPSFKHVNPSHLIMSSATLDTIKILPHDRCVHIHVEEDPIELKKEISTTASFNPKITVENVQKEISGNRKYYVYTCNDTTFHQQLDAWEVERVDLNMMKPSFALEIVARIASTHLTGECEAFKDKTLILFTHTIANTERYAQVLNGKYHDIIDAHVINSGTMRTSYTKKKIKNVDERIPGKLTVYISTPVLQSGYNVPDCVAVIDECAEISQVYNHYERSRRTITHEISENAQIQRKGRIGRMDNGLYVKALPPDTDKIEIPSATVSQKLDSICIDLLEKEIQPQWLFYNSNTRLMNNCMRVEMEFLMHLGVIHNIKTVMPSFDASGKPQRELEIGNVFDQLPHLVYYYECVDAALLMRFLLQEKKLVWTPFLLCIYIIISVAEPIIDTKDHKEGLFNHEFGTLITCAKILHDFLYDSSFYIRPTSKSDSFSLQFVYLAEPPRKLIVNKSSLRKCVEFYNLMYRAMQYRWKNKRASLQQYMPTDTFQQIRSWVIRSNLPTHVTPLVKPEDIHQPLPSPSTIAEIVDYIIEFGSRHRLMSLKTKNEYVYHQALKHHYSRLSPSARVYLPYHLTKNAKDEMPRLVIAMGDLYRSSDSLFYINLFVEVPKHRVQAVIKSLYPPETVETPTVTSSSSTITSTAQEDSSSNDTEIVTTAKMRDVSEYQL